MIQKSPQKQSASSNVASEDSELLGKQWRVEEKDYLKYMANSESSKMLKLEGDERVILSCEMVKINKKEKAQTRNFVLTTKRILNAGKKVKRSIDLVNLAGISLSSESHEFVIHVVNDYDYRFSSEKFREIVIYYTVVAYYNITQMQQRIFVHREAGLQHCCTLESDRDKKRSRIPTSNGLTCYPWDLNIHVANQFLDSFRDQEVIYIREHGILTAWIKSFIPQMKISSTQVNSPYNTIYFSRCMLRALQDMHYAVRTIKCENCQDREVFISKIHAQRKDAFVVPLEFCFREGPDIYLVMRVLSNDLYQRLFSQHNFTESIAKYYFAQVICGIELYHDRLNEPYGELKPENILLDEKGRVFLTGYRAPSKNYINETLEYTAPELLKGEVKSKHSDLWSLGVFLYEILVGVPPFYYENNEQIMIQLILEAKVFFPKFLSISDSAKELIVLLLQTDKNNRIGAGADGLKEIKSHKWLSNVDWNAHKKKVSLPFDGVLDAFESQVRRVKYDYLPLEPNETTYL